MALDDFETSDSELDLDEDLFDFPQVDLDSEEPADDDFPQEVVAAAAALQSELDNPDEDPGLFEMSADELGLDLDLDDLLADQEYDSVDYILDAEDKARAPKKAPKPETKVETVPEESAPPKTEAKPVRQPAAAPAEPQAVPPAVVATAPAASAFSLRGSLPFVAAILLFNVVLLTLGLVGISSVSSSVDGFAARLADVASELRNTPIPPVEIVVPTPVSAEPQPEPEVAKEPVVTAPRVKLPPFARGEITAARDAMDRGEYKSARRRLFRLLATIDDPLAEDAPEAEEQANLLIAETYLLEADSARDNAGGMSRSEG